MNIDIRDVSVSFSSEEGILPVVRHVNLALQQGYITAVVGESGSGKSILGAAVMGLLGPAAAVTGEISFDGKNLLALGEEEMNHIRGRKIAWIAQDPISAMNPVMKTGIQVTEGICYIDGTSARDEKGKGLAQLKRYGLSDGDRVYESYPGELSGGMAQRVLMAMMTMTHPSWLIADEPTKGLDAFVRKEAACLFRKLRDEEGTGILLITHDLKLAERISDDMAVIYAGEIVEWGKTKDIFTHPRHPYTKGLMAARPDADFRPIPGRAPSFAQLPAGCAFASRCPFRSRECSQKQIMRSCGEKQMTRCWRGGSL